MTSCIAEKPTGTIVVEDVRRLFPIFANAADTIFFDNASTTQKPQAVVDEIVRYYTQQCANAGRASYVWSTRASLKIEETREALATLLNAEPHELVFTAGATDSLNMVALAWGLENLRDGDEVMLCPQDHKSAVLPWYNLQRLLAARGVNVAIKHFHIHEVGDYDLKSVREAVSGRTRVVAMSHVHHLYGLDMEVPQMRQIVGPDVVISLDASQSAGHVPVDVQALDVDFVSMSAHKMFGPTGVGALWIAAKHHRQLCATRPGGKTSISIVNNQMKCVQTSPASLLESGTQNISSILGWKPAIELILSLGQAEIEAAVGRLTRRLYFGLQRLPGLEFAPGPGVCGCPGGNGIIAFRFEQIPTSDLAFLLDSEKIFVRSGDHCLSSRAEGDDFVRISLHVYNTQDEVDQVLAVLQDCAG